MASGDGHIGDTRTRRVFNRKTGEWTIQINRDGAGWHELGSSSSDTRSSEPKQKHPKKPQRPSNEDKPLVSSAQAIEAGPAEAPPEASAPADSAGTPQGFTLTNKTTGEKLRISANEDDADPEVKTDKKKKGKAAAPVVQQNDDGNRAGLSTSPRFMQASEDAMFEAVANRYYRKDAGKYVLGDFQISHDLEDIIQKAIIGMDEGTALEIRDTGDKRISNHKNVVKAKDEQVTKDGITGDDGDLFNLSKRNMENLIVRLHNEKDEAAFTNFAKFVIAKKYCAQPGFMQLHPALQEAVIGIALVKGPEAAMWVLDNAVEHVTERDKQHLPLGPDKAKTEKEIVELGEYAKLVKGVKLSELKPEYQRYLAATYGHGKLEGVKVSEVKTAEGKRFQGDLAKGYSPNPSFGSPIMRYGPEKAALLNKHAKEEHRDRDDIAFYDDWKSYYRGGMGPEFFQRANDAFAKYNGTDNALMKEMIDCWKHHHMLDVATDHYIGATRPAITTEDGIVYGENNRAKFLEGWIARAERRDPETGDPLLKAYYASQKNKAGPDLVTADRLEALKEGLNPSTPFLSPGAASYQNYVIKAEPIYDKKGEIVNYQFTHYQDCGEGAETGLRVEAAAHGARIIRVTRDGELQPLGKQSTALFMMAAADLARESRKGYASEYAEIRDCSHFTEGREGALTRTGVSETVVSTFMNMLSIPRAVESGIHCHLVQEDPAVRGLLLRAAKGGALPNYHTELTMGTRAKICKDIVQTNKYKPPNVYITSIHFDGPELAGNVPDPGPSGTFVLPSRNKDSIQLGMDVRDRFEEIGGTTSIKTTRKIVALSAKDLETINVEDTAGVSFNDMGLQNSLAGFKMCLVELGNGAHPLESQNLCSVACLTAYENGLSSGNFTHMLRSGAKLYDSPGIVALADQLPNMKKEQLVAHYATMQQNAPQLAQLSTSGSAVPAGEAILQIEVPADGSALLSANPLNSDPVGDLHESLQHSLSFAAAQAELGSLPFTLDALHPEAKNTKLLPYDAQTIEAMRLDIARDLQPVDSLLTQGSQPAPVLPQPTEPETALVAQPQPAVIADNTPAAPVIAPVIAEAPVQPVVAAPVVVPTAKDETILRALAPGQKQESAAQPEAEKEISPAQKQASIIEERALAGAAALVEKQKNLNIAVPLPEKKPEPEPEKTAIASTPTEKPSFWNRVHDAINGLSDLMSGKAKQKIFQLGDKDDPAIASAQKFLIEDGLLPRESPTDDFDKPTKTALIAFQKKFDKPFKVGHKTYTVEPDGKLGKVTGLAMNAYALANGNMDVAYNLMKSNLAAEQTMLAQTKTDIRTPEQIGREMLHIVSNTSAAMPDNAAALSTQAPRKAAPEQRDIS